MNKADVAKLFIIFVCVLLFLPVMAFVIVLLPLFAGCLIATWFMQDDFTGAAFTAVLLGIVLSFGWINLLISLGVLS